MLQSDDFSLCPDRLFALRLLHVRGINIEAVEGVFQRARDVFFADQVDSAAGEMRDALELFQAGERLAAMEKAQAAWNTANHLNDLMTNGATAAGRKLKQGGRKGAEASKISRRGESSGRSKVLAEAKAYSGSPAARVTTIAKRASVTAQYVRKVLKDAKL
ncbi:hypothetical protein [Dyella sp. GSA-30]|uniref:hypothetical protein n=1 Tax=Dyella sp. GSA-30 TaxID=2994496 RepID=UPI002490D9D6|nr:hypothetical protein [Dyella sp. GSA-30]